MSDDEVIHKHIDMIYAAMLGEGNWQAFLDSLSSLLPNGKSLMFYHDVDSGCGAFALNAGFDPSFASAYSEHYAAINPWIQGATTRPIGRVVRAEAMLDRRELESTEFHDGFLRPQNLATGIGVTIMREEGCNFMLSVLGDEAEDEIYDKAVARVQAMAPHLRRAYSWYRRAGDPTALHADRGLLEDNTRAAILRLGVGRRIRSINRASEAILRRHASIVAIDRGQRFQCAQASVCEHIDAALVAALQGERFQNKKSHLVMTKRMRHPLRITLLPPLAKPAERFFRGPECIVVIEEPFQRLDRVAAEYSTLHRLTGAETRLVSKLAAGRSIAAVAAETGVARETLRRQLKSVFAKTGHKRQSELVRSIASLASAIQSD